MRFLIATSFVLSLPLWLACTPGPTACTLIGCSSTVTIALPQSQSAAFPVTVSAPGLTGSFECVPPSDGSAGWSAVSFSGDLRESGPAIATARCGPDEVFLDFLADDPEMPASLTVTVDGEVDIEQTFSDIEYEVSQPNGPDCPPTCRTATLVLE